MAYAAQAAAGAADIAAPPVPNSGVAGRAEARLETNDLEQLNEWIASIVAGASFAATSAVGLGAGILGRKLPRSSLLKIGLTHGRAMLMPGQGFGGITIPMRRGFEAVEGRRVDYVAPGTGYVWTGRTEIEFQPDDASDLLAVNLDHDLIGCYAAEPDTSPKRVLDWLPSRLDLRSDPAVSLVWALHSIMNEDPGALRGFDRTPLSVETESLLADLLVQACLAQVGPLTTRKGDLARIDRAEEYLRSVSASPVSLADVALAAGTSVRSLTRGFRKRFGVSPMRFLQNLRLDATHRELLASVPAERTVTDVAFARGISHLGRFACGYRQRFGECPSETLGRRHQGCSQ